MSNTETGPIASAADLSPDKLTASERRALQPLLITTWSLQALWPRLPLLFPGDPDLPPSPKTRYRSQYRFPGAEPLKDPAQLAVMSPFEVSLHLIDFSPLEPLLAQHYRHSHKGEVPFHPLSMFLTLLLRRELNLSWRGVATLLASAHGVGWRTLCGFQAPELPSASGLRYFSLQVGADLFDQLCQRFVTLLLREELCSEQSTYPGDPPGQGVSITQDGMLHPARHRHTCAFATDGCYQPLPEPADSPTARPCRARAQGHEGCSCDTPACHARCRQASALDPQARLIHYDGRNKAPPPDAERKHPSPSAGTTVFGYRSIADRILDDRLHVAWTARSVLYPANTDERTVFVQDFTCLRQQFPTLRIGEWIDDAAIGFEDCLQAIWEADALRMVDTRADPGDQDPQTCLLRGYDAQGHPLCPHGYPLHSNGYDHQRRRRKWLCRQTCRRQPLRQGEAVQPVTDCPYYDARAGHRHGLVVNVGFAFPDGSPRLAREIPYGSPQWKARYGRRSNAESRNAQLEGMGLKRMRSYGLPRNTQDVQMADLIINLRTMGRLVWEASRLSPSDPDG